ncbi:hypothetical protein ACQP1V_11705 [Microtetraspora malaysiensis]|uniref:hypothetical protein n=1 Tax=Microtetraspora malaysiensis TaxID=161358 RepID=UPI003D8B548B
MLGYGAGDRSKHGDHCYLEEGATFALFSVEGKEPSDDKAGGADCEKDVSACEPKESKHGAMLWQML